MQGSEFLKLSFAIVIFVAIGFIVASLIVKLIKKK